MSEAGSEECASCVPWTVKYASGQSSDDLTTPRQVVLPSIGSDLHAVGGCKPCSWFFKVGGCHNGQECLHCHLCTKFALKAHKKKLMSQKQAQRRQDASSELVPGVEQATFSPPPGLEPSMEQQHQPSFEGSSFDSNERFSICSSFERSSFDSDISIGSEFHAEGKCRPCAWFWKSAGCQNGRECLHCHLCQKGEMKLRKKQRAEVPSKLPEVRMELLQGMCEIEAVDDQTTAVSTPNIDQPLQRLDDQEVSMLGPSSSSPLTEDLQMTQLKYQQRLLENQAKQIKELQKLLLQQQLQLCSISKASSANAMLSSLPSVPPGCGRRPSEPGLQKKTNVILRFLA